MQLACGWLIRCFKPKSASNASINNIVGERCVVTERIDNFAGCGEVKVKGRIWAARGVTDDDIFEVGERISIVAIEGVKLICKK
jgi:membrane protein implicated in regulation of membrane protease activity